MSPVAPPLVFSRDSRRALRLVATALAGAVLGAHGRAIAAEPAPPPAPSMPALRVLVRVTSSQDWAQSTRIRGQISDLDVELAEVPSAALEPARPEQIDAAAVLARQLRGDLVIWLQGADV